MSSQIKKIVLDLDGKEVELTLRQAKKLYVLLSELCGAQEYKKEPIYIPVPFRPWRWDNPYWCWDKTTYYSKSSDELKYGVSYQNNTVTLSV